MQPTGHTSDTTDRIDAVAGANGWTRSVNNIGDAVRYRRRTLYVDVFLSVTGGVIYASTNRRGGRHTVGAGKADWVIEQLEA